VPQKAAGATPTSPKVTHQNRSRKMDLRGSELKGVAVAVAAPG